MNPVNRDDDRTNSALGHDLAPGLVRAIHSPPDGWSVKLSGRRPAPHPTRLCRERTVVFQACRTGRGTTTRTPHLSPHHYINNSRDVNILQRDPCWAGPSR